MSSGRNQRFWQSLFQERSFQKLYHPNTVFGTLRTQWIAFWAMLWFPFGFWNTWNGISGIAPPAAQPWMSVRRGAIRLGPHTGNPHRGGKRPCPQAASAFRVQKRIRSPWNGSGDLQATTARKEAVPLLAVGTEPQEQANTWRVTSDTLVTQGFFAPKNPCKYWGLN